MPFILLCVFAGFACFVWVGRAVVVFVVRAVPVSAQREIRSCFFLGGCRGCLYRGHCRRWACLGGVGGSGGRMGWGGGCLVANPSKFQIMFLGLHQPHKLCLEINNQIVPSSDTVKFLGIDIDSKLSFDNHVKAVCVKASRKVSAFSRVANFITFEQAKLLYNSFIMSNFGYCPLIWMFCGKTANEEINRIHKRALRRLYNDFNSNFEELLARSGEKTVHLQNLEKLLLEVFKSLHQINPAFMWELFERKEVNYNLRNKDLLRIPKFQTITYGANSISYRGSYLWNSIPDVVKSCERVLSFKRKLREWNGRTCTCRVCK